MHAKGLQTEILQCIILAVKDGLRRVNIVSRHVQKFQSFEITHVHQEWLHNSTKNYKRMYFVILEIQWYLVCLAFQLKLEGGGCSIGILCLACVECLRYKQITLVTNNTIITSRTNPKAPMTA